MLCGCLVGGCAAPGALGALGATVMFERALGEESYWFPYFQVRLFQTR